MGKATRKVKTGLYATLGKAVWLGLSKVGIPYAKRKVAGHGDGHANRRAT